jgi:hypothetical protein
MNDLRTAAQQALEALEEYQSKGAPFWACDAAVTALRAALAQQEEGRMEFNIKETVCAKCGSTNGAHSHDCPVAKAALAQQEQEQEPVAWRYKGMMGMPWSLSDDGYYVSCKRDKGYTVEPLYTHPPRREWQSLTEEEIAKCWHDTPWNADLKTRVFAFFHTVEAALKERNT